MSLKLIREATLVATLDKSELKALSAMKTGSRLQEADEKMQLWTADSGNYDAHHPERHKSIGYFKTQSEAKTALDKCPNKKMMGPVHSVAGYASWLKKGVNESFTPGDNDFDAWMRVIVGEAGDRGVNLNKKSQFMELAMDVLENDPASPPLDMQEMIATKLWQDYNSAKNTVRINKLAQAKEEEEKVLRARKQIASRYATGPTSVTPSTEEEEMGISDDLAARKIFNKIKGTPNLNFAVVQQYVNKYLGAVGKRPTDAKYLSALVYSLLQDANMASEEEEVEDFVRNGGEIQYIPPRKARNSEKLKGSAHIGKTGERRGRSTTGNAANSLGRPVIGLTKLGKEEEESGFAQVLKSAIGTEDEEDDLRYSEDGEEWYDEHGHPDPNGAYDAGGHFDMERFMNNGDEDYLKDQAIDNSFEDEESSTSDAARMRGYRDYHSHRGNPYDPGTKEYHDWYLGRSEAEHERHGYEDEEPSFVRDALRDQPTTSMKGSFSSHLRGEDNFDDEDDMEISFGPDSVEGVSDDEVFTSDDDECECSCDGDDDLDPEDIEADGFDDAELDATDDEMSDDEMDTPEDELDDETMDDVDADVEPRAPKKGFDEEEAVKSFFRQAVTSPNDMMRQAVKDIEEEGKTAWKKANVPANPHPQKSQAYRAWQKGLLNAAKEALGIVDKPAAPKAKPKRKK